MFSYDFHERKAGSRAVYGPSWILKGLSAFFLIPIAVGLCISIDEHTLDAASAVPCMVFLLLIMTLLFRDSWIFDNEKRTAESVFGFGPFVRRESFPYDSIERIEVTHFIKGIPEYSQNQKPSWRHKAQVVLALRLGPDDRKAIEIMGERKSAGKLERNASWLAGFTGLSLYVDRPRDARVGR